MKIRKSIAGIMALTICAGFIGNSAFAEISDEFVVNAEDVAEERIPDETFEETATTEVISEETTIAEESTEEVAVAEANTDEISEESITTEETTDIADSTENVLEYKVYADHVEITGCGDYAETVKIPAMIEGLPVTSIEHGAFFSLDYLTSVTIPDTVTNIGSQAFDYCEKLTSVTLPDNEVTIEWSAFGGCISLTEIVIPNSGTIIESGAFSGCTSLAEIKMPSGVTNVGSSAFDGTEWYENQPDGMVYLGNILYKFKGEMPENTSVELKEGTLSIADGAFDSTWENECVNLISVTLPDSLKSIGNCAFADCSNLKSITLPNGLTNIGYDAFRECSSLTEIVIPDSVVNIGDRAFIWCYNLESVTIPKNIKNIGYEAFYSTKWLEEKQKENSLVIINGVLIDGKNCEGSVSIPDGVTAIAGNAFEYCRSLTKITIPDSVTSIGESAFSYCTALEEITIPDSVTEIKSYAFSGCEILTKINIPDNITKISDGLFSCCGSLVQITLPENIESIGNNAFSECVNLKKIDIPEKVTYIGTDAFKKCAGLEEVILHEGLNQIDSYAFIDCLNLKSITVPKSVRYLDSWCPLGYYWYAYSSNESRATQIDDFKIYGYVNSEAEKYAISNGFEFIALDREEPPTTEDPEIPEIPEETTTEESNPSYPEYDTEYAEFSIEQKTITPDEANDEITVAFSLDNDTVINVTALRFNYDEDLTLVGMKFGSVFSELMNDDAINGSVCNGETGEAAIAITSGNTIGGVSGELILLTFKINNPEIGKEYEISAVNSNPVIQEVIRGDRYELTPSFKNGYIKIADEAELPETDETTTDSASNYFASIDELCEMALKDYEKKTGITPSSTEYTKNDDETVSIKLFDENGNILDIYVIDPVTGIGNDSANKEVNLPQTGNNNTNPLAVACSAFLTAIAGAFTMLKSGIIRRKENEDR